MPLSNFDPNQQPLALPQLQLQAPGGASTFGPGGTNQSAMQNSLFAGFPQAGQPQSPVRSIFGDANFGVLPGTNTPAGDFQPTFMQKLMGYSNPDNGFQFNGALLPALDTATGLASAYMGFKNYGLAKDQLKQSREEFNKQFGVQQSLTNQQLEDRQEARVASSSSATPVDEYMAQHRI